MKLYIARHGHAVDASENPDRPLSDHGKTEIERMASFLARAGVRPQRILHSGKARAAQTAMIYSRVISDGTLVQERAGLMPMDDPSVVAEAMEDASLDTLIAGHLPHLGRLTALLLTRDAETQLVDMPTGSMVCLSRGLYDEGWTMAWMLDPGLLG